MFVSRYRREYTVTQLTDHSLWLLIDTLDDVHYQTGWNPPHKR